ncbi:MAG: 5-amino-6-(D-ribitylamino)uracil--L-tyrosine 4-hydroxyphenyl transferase CofH [Deltaproteobacteria bacterium]|nr:5-amino-6-(D-ribitylamino)uracil--L-tyrosine 4-hydroxyphenyl transferase CofH [Deltaproteobacteria bacterium]
MWDDVRAVVQDPRSLEQLLAAATPATARRLTLALDGGELSAEDGEALLGLEGDDLVALVKAADAARAADVGEVVTYVVNRNINWTNVCFVGCQFCAFAVHRKDASAYNHSIDDVLVKVQDAVDRGASEVCMQGGINPETDAFFYRDLLRAIKTRFPQLHVHAFSPMEVMYGARRTGMTYRDYLAMLRDAGLGTVPGTAAEILDDDVREVLSHKKVDVRTWIDIITAAHELGVRSSSTVMYGHVETMGHVARHIALLRDMQKRTGGFTEFVPLRFIHTLTQLYAKGLVTPPPVGLLDLRVYATARLMLRGWIDNLQTSWVKLGTELAQLTLAAGCNDFGGTLMEESISKAAGADFGEYLPEADIRALIEGAGRRPVQRTTTYGHIAADGQTQPGRSAGWRSGRGAVPAGPVLAS